MKELRIIISRDNVFEEVSKTTSFDGAKRETGDGTYERVMATDDDRQMMARSFDEAAQTAESAFCDVPYDIETDTEQWAVTLHVSNAFNDKATQSINSDMFSFFCESILEKWYATTLPEVSNRHAQLALGYLTDASKKIWFKGAPIP